jgi:hypothetical protein
MGSPSVWGVAGGGDVVKQDRRIRALMARAAQLRFDPEMIPEKVFRLLMTSSWWKIRPTGSVTHLGRMTEPV